MFLFQTASQSGSLIGPEACPRIELEGTSDGKLLVPSGTRMKIPVKAIHLKVSEFIVATLTITSQLQYLFLGAQWLSGRVLDSRPRGHGFEPHRRHCVVVLEQDTFIIA